MIKAFLGIGHGGTDPGAIGIGGIREEDVNLNVGLACSGELSRHGVTVLMSRDKDEDDPLADVIREANAFKPDIAVDIHANAGGGDGFEAFYQTNVHKSKSLALAKNTEAEIIKIGQNSRGCKTKLNASGTDYFGFLRQVNAPAVLVECAFLDNANDVRQIDELHEQQAFGVAIAKGMLKTLGVAWVDLVRPAVPQPVAKVFTLDLPKLKEQGYAEVSIKL